MELQRINSRSFQPFLQISNVFHQKVNAENLSTCPLQKSTNGIKEGLADEEIDYQALGTLANSLMSLFIF
jgi:hypothetical protein